jgi:hypothetical protein
MSSIQRQMVQIEIDNLETILAGGEANGVSLGMNGMTAEFVLSLISDRMTILEGGE